LDLRVSEELANVTSQASSLSKSFPSVLRKMRPVLISGVSRVRDRGKHGQDQDWT